MCPPRSYPRTPLLALLSLALLLAGCQDRPLPTAPLAPGPDAALLIASGGASLPQVSAGNRHTCAIKANGTIACWGDNSNGQATAPIGTFTQVSAGVIHTCAIKPGGTIACWGSNSRGQMNAPSGTFTQLSGSVYHSCAISTDDDTLACWGDNSSGQTNTPIGTTFTQVSAGGAHTCAVKTDGTIACWGSDGSGRATAPSGFFTQVSAGAEHTCGVKTDGTIACWGSDGSGRATAPSGTFTQVSAGGNHTCAIKTVGTLACWGSTFAGKTTAPSGFFTQVSAGNGHTCAVKTDGTIACWGVNVDGQTNVPAELTEVQDDTAPVITAVPTGTPGSNGWYTSDVTVSWTVVDNESAITSQPCTSTTISSDTNGQTLTCTATSAGGTSSQSVTIKRDATAPALSPSVSPNPVLLNGSATATPGASDATSGLASSSCDAVGTGTAGAKTMSCTATDNAGNTNSASASYTVAYDFSGFTAPVSNDGLNTAKAGQTIALKWRLLDATGAPVLDLAGAEVTVASLACDLGTTENQVAEEAAGSSGLQNLGDGYYQYNWKTSKGYANSCKTMQLDLGEGSSPTADFQFTK